MITTTTTKTLLLNITKSEDVKESSRRAIVSLNNLIHELRKVNSEKETIDDEYAGNNVAIHEMEEIRGMLCQMFYNCVNK